MECNKKIVQDLKVCKHILFEIYTELYQSHHKDTDWIRMEHFEEAAEDER